MEGKKQSRFKILFKKKDKKTQVASSTTGRSRTSSLKGAMEIEARDTYTRGQDTARGSERSRSTDGTAKRPIGAGDGQQSDNNKGSSQSTNSFRGSMWSETPPPMSPPILEEVQPSGFANHGKKRAFLRARQKVRYEPVNTLDTSAANTDYATLGGDSRLMTDKSVKRYNEDVADRNIKRESLIPYIEEPIDRKLARSTDECTRASSNSTPVSVDGSPHAGRSPFGRHKPMTPETAKAIQSRGDWSCKTPLHERRMDLERWRNTSTSGSSPRDDYSSQRYVTPGSDESHADSIDVRQFLDERVRVGSTSQRWGYFDNPYLDGNADERTPGGASCPRPIGRASFTTPQESPRTLYPDNRLSATSPLSRRSYKSEESSRSNEPTASSLADDRYFIHTTDGTMVEISPGEFSIRMSNLTHGQNSGRARSEPNVSFADEDSDHSDQQFVIFEDFEDTYHESLTPYAPPPSTLEDFEKMALSLSSASSPSRRNTIAPIDRRPCSAPQLLMTDAMKNSLPDVLPLTLKEMTESQTFDYDYASSVFGDLSSCMSSLGEQMEGRRWLRRSTGGIMS